MFAITVYAFVRFYIAALVFDFCFLFGCFDYTTLSIVVILLSLFMTFSVNVLPFYFPRFSSFFCCYKNNNKMI